MKRPVANLFLVAVPVLAILVTSVVSAQTKGGQPDPGVTPIRQLDREDVRVTRVEVEAGATRSAHTHDDVRFHLFIPVSGKLELTIAKQKPVEVNPGQVIYIEKSTPHGFRNLGTTKAVIMEVFVKADSTAADDRHVIELVRAIGAGISAVWPQRRSLFMHLIVRFEPKPGKAEAFREELAQPRARS